METKFETDALNINWTGVFAYVYFPPISTTEGSSGAVCTDNTTCSMPIMVSAASGVDVTRKLPSLPRLLTQQRGQLVH